MASDSGALSVATKQYLQIIRVNTLNRWGNVETLGTDNHTYPSKNGKIEETLGKRTDVRGIVPPKNPCLGILNVGLVSNELG